MLPPFILLSKSVDSLDWILAPCKQNQKITFLSFPVFGSQNLHSLYRVIILLEPEQLQLGYHSNQTCTESKNFKQTPHQTKLIHVYSFNTFHRKLFWLHF